MRSTSAILLCLALLAGCTPSPSSDAELVVDKAGLLDAEQLERIATFHRLLRLDYDIDYRVVTAPDTRDVDAHAPELFESLGAGELSSKGRGLLLVIDPVQNRVRLEVGYALEGTYPDAFIAYIEQRQMVPFFRAGRVADGILSTTEMIVTRADAAVTNASLDSEIWLEGSGGAGASTLARLGEGADTSFAKSNTKVSAGTSPASTLAKYFAAMRDRNASSSLEIYTPATRRMLKDWVMTPAQMDNLVTAYRRCHAETPRFDSTRRYAVIRYPVAERQCSPWFFENIDGSWALDLTMLQRAIRFGRDNSWHFERGVEHPYEYAFDDWVVDSRGYPQAKR